MQSNQFWALHSGSEDGTSGDEEAACTAARAAELATAGSGPASWTVSAPLAAAPVAASWRPLLAAAWPAAAACQKRI